MAYKVVSEQRVFIRLACLVSRISESCYRYERKLDADNDEVVNLLIKLTDKHLIRGFCLSCLFLSMVKGF